MIYILLFLLRSTANAWFYSIYLKNRYSYYVTKVSELKLTIGSKNVRKYFANEVVDLVCDNFSDSKSEEEGGEEIYSYHGGTAIEASELNLLTKAVTSSQVEEVTSF